jgi:hypothetical protein
MPSRAQVAAQRSARSASAISTFGVESPSAKSSSSAVHHALSETDTAPMPWMPAKAITHSG